MYNSNYFLLIILLLMYRDWAAFISYATCRSVQSYVLIKNYYNNKIKMCKKNWLQYYHSLLKGGHPAVQQVLYNKPFLPESGL